MHGKVSSVRRIGGRLLADLPAQFSVGRYHSLCAVRASLPPALQVVAESEDGVVMALEHQSLPLAAVQFHPESVMSNDQRGKAQRSEAPGLSQLSPGQKPALPVKPASVSFAPNNSWLYSNPTPSPQGLGVGSSSELVSPTWQGEVVSQKPTPRKPLTDYFYAPFRQ